MSEELGVRNVKLGDVLNYEQPTKYIVSSENYSDNFATPVLTAGQTFILGYTDETDNIYFAVPVIIFDDFTTAIKYVDFPFKVKSSAMKILTASENADIKYLYYLMTTIQIDTQLHKRYWISQYANIEIPLPPLAEQVKIAAELDKISGLIAKRKRQIKLLDTLAKARFIEMFGDPIVNNKQLQTTDLINIVKLQRGFDLPVQLRSFGSIPVYGSNGILDSHSQAKVFGGGVITGRSGTIGKVYYTEQPFWPLNTTLFSIDTKGNNIVFLSYLLNYFDLSRFADGSGVPTLNRNNIHNKQTIDIPLPLQIEFADYIAKIETTKAKMQTALAKLETMYKAIMQKYFE